MKLSVYALFIVVLTACVGIKVDVGDASAFRQAAYQSYAWESAPIKSDGRDDKLFYLDRYLRRAVDRDLQQLGYQLVSKEQAGFLVTYRYFETVSNDQGGPISPSDEMAANYDFGSDVNNTNIHNHYIPVAIKRGHLELLFIDRAKNKPVWHAVAEKIIEDDSPDKSSFRKRSSKLADKLLKEIPAR